MKTRKGPSASLFGCEVWLRSLRGLLPDWLLLIAGEVGRCSMSTGGRDLLGQAASGVFNHLLRFDPDFDFPAVLGPVSETIHVALAEWDEVYVEDHVTRLAPECCSVSSGEDASS
ncbi:hypothetical protein D1007_02790 [Hordeum vulgare]|nr:hypothetical protein D1007_02790 [Hordeum vulgare]